MNSDRLISVIIPTWNEGRQIEACLRQFDDQPGAWECIVADGGSEDETTAQARALGASVVACSRRGRGPQQNEGASQARGRILLFLHADARLPEGAHALITATLDQPGVAAGAFRVRHDFGDRRDFRTRLLRLADLRSHWTRRPYGDQGLFMTLAAFTRSGGFPDKVLMEDVGLARALARLGRIHTVPGTVTVSARRLDRHPLRAFLCMNLFPLLDRLGVRPQTLARLYGHPR